MTLWYQDGLDFQCAQCGRCCGGSPGVVWIDDLEIRRIAAHLAIDPADMWGPILRRVLWSGGWSRVSLTERGNGDCVFLKRGPNGERACTIYDLRPQQCRTWPFWAENLASRAAWDRLAVGCPGMNHGRRHDVAAIEAVRNSRPWYEPGGQG